MQASHKACQAKDVPAFTCFCSNVSAICFFFFSFFFCSFLTSVTINSSNNIVGTRRRKGWVQDFVQQETEGGRKGGKQTIPPIFLVRTSNGKSLLAQVWTESGLEFNSICIPSVAKVLEQNEPCCRGGIRGGGYLCVDNKSLTDLACYYICMIFYFISFFFKLAAVFVVWLEDISWAGFVVTCWHIFTATLSAA